MIPAGKLVMTTAPALPTPANSCLLPTGEPM